MYFFIYVFKSKKDRLVLRDHCVKLSINYRYHFNLSLPVPKESKRMRISLKAFVNSSVLGRSYSSAK